MADIRFSSIQKWRETHPNNPQVHIGVCNIPEKKSHLKFITMVNKNGVEEVITQIANDRNN